MSAGTSNGACGQPSASRVAWTSSLPSGAPCELSLPALAGLPKPIVVRQQISVGRAVSARAVRTAIATSSGSWPSTLRMTCQP